MRIKSTILAVLVVLLGLLSLPTTAWALKVTPANSLGVLTRSQEEELLQILLNQHPQDRGLALRIFGMATIIEPRRTGKPVKIIIKEDRPGELLPELGVVVVDDTIEDCEVFTLNGDGAFEGSPSVTRGCGFAFFMFEGTPSTRVPLKLELNLGFVNREASKDCVAQAKDQLIHQLAQCDSLPPNDQEACRQSALNQYRASADRCHQPQLAQVTPISDDEARSSGPGHPWQGSLPGVNPFSLAKETVIPIIGWQARGGFPVDFALYHSSQAVRSNPAIGPGWLHSYDIMLDIWRDKTGTQKGAVILGHIVQLFALSQGTWIPVDGYRDKLTTSGAGFVLTMKTSQVRLEFEPHPAVTNRFWLKRIVDANGNAVTLTYNQQNQLSSVTDPSNRAVRFEYSASNGTLDSVSFIDIGIFWKFISNNGRLTRVIYPPVTTDKGVETFQTSFEYNANDLITKVIDRSGRAWTYRYHGRRLASTQPPANTRKQQWECKHAGDASEFKDPLGNTTTYTFDRESRLISVQDALGNKTRLSYNDADYVWDPDSVTLPSDRVWRYDHDAAGNRVIAFVPSGDATNYAYDSSGRLTQIIEPQVTGETARHRLDILRDATGNPTDVRRFTDATNYVSTRFEYDSFGQLISAIDPLGHAWTYEYDFFGNPIRVTSPMGREQRWLYENAQATLGFTRPDAYINGLGQRSDIKRDAWGRIPEIVHPDGTRTNFSYGPRNELVKMIDSTGITEWTFDANVRVETYRSLSAQLNYTYFPHGERKSLAVTLPASQRLITYGYDQDGRLTELMDQGGSVNYQYDVDGLLTRKSLSNGVVTNYEHDFLGRVSTITVANSDQTLHRAQVEWRADNLPGKISGSDGGLVIISWDPLSRIAEEHRTCTEPNCLGPYDAIHRYDAAGNRTSRTFDGNTTIYGYDEDNLPVVAQNASGLISYSWNANAQLVERASPVARVRFPWNSAGNLGGIEQFNGTDWVRIASFSYNGLGLRTAMSFPEVDDEVLVQFLHDGRTVIRDTTVSQTSQNQLHGTQNREYLWAFGLERTRNVDTNQNAWSITDLFGSLRKVTNDQGHLGSYAAVFSGFGESIVEQGQSPSPYKWAADFGIRTEPLLAELNLSYNDRSNEYYLPEIVRSINGSSGDDIPNVLRGALKFDLGSFTTSASDFVVVEPSYHSDPTRRVIDYAWAGPLGPPIGPTGGSQLRHRFFSIIDRTLLAANIHSIPGTASPLMPPLRPNFSVTGGKPGWESSTPSPSPLDWIFHIPYDPRNTMGEDHALQYWINGKLGPGSYGYRDPCP